MKLVRMTAGVAAVAVLVGLGLVYTVVWAMEKLEEDEAHEDEPEVAEVIDLRGSAFSLPGMMRRASGGEG